MKRNFLLIFLLTLTCSLFAQRDTEFWFVCPNIVSGTGAHSDNHMKLCFITYDQPTTITISQPAGDPASFTYFAPQTIAVAANSLVNFSLTPYKSLIKDNGGGARPFGLLIQADQEIMAYFINTSDDCEAYTLKGRNALGTEFIIPMQYDFENAYGGHNFIELVATEDNTQVEIELMPNITTPTAVPDANNKIQVTLNKGWTYSLRSTDTAGNKHLHNTHITADKPIAVNTTDDGVSPGDLMGDQILPVDMLGTKYIAIKNDGETEYVYFFATEDNTTINVYSQSNNGEVVKTYTLSRGQFGAKVSRYAFSQKRSDQAYKAIYIESDKPIVVFQMTGEEPAGAILPQLECTGSNEVAFQSVLDQVWADIVVKADYISGFTVNGDPNALTTEDFEPVPGTNNRWYWARKQFAANTILRVKNSRGVFHLGMYDQRGNSSSLAYFSDFKGAQLNATASADHYLTNDTLNLTLFDATSYSNVVWQCPNGTIVEGNPLVIPHATLADAGQYYVTAEHVDGCVLQGGTMVVAQIFEQQHADTTICQGDVVTIQDTKGNKDFSPNDTVMLPVYSIKQGFNLLQGSNFNTDSLYFQSGYTNDPTLAADETYRIINRTAIDHAIEMRTSNRNGINLLSQSVSMVAARTYTFSIEASSTNSNSPLRLQFALNGTYLGTPFTPTSSWNTYTYNYISAAELQGTLSLILLSGAIGENVRLDNFVCLPQFEIADSLQVNVRPLPVPVITGDPYLCEGKAAMEVQEGFSAYEWRKTDGTVLSHERQTILTEPGIYEVSVQDADGICWGLATMQLKNGITLQAELDEIGHICQGEAFISLPYVVTQGDLASCRVRYNAAAQQQGFKDNEEIDFEQNMLQIPLPANMRADLYEVTLEMQGGSACGGQQTFTRQFMVHYDPKRIMQQKWDDVIALYNSQYNGGYNFTSYQWYRNGEILEGETGSYLCTAPYSLSADDVYAVLLTRDDGVTMLSCDFQPAYKQKIPSLVQRASRFPISATATGTALFYNLNGQCISRQPIAADLSYLTSPAQAGLYILHIQYEDATIQTYKLLVQ